MSNEQEMKFVSLGNIKDRAPEANPSPIRIIRWSDRERLLQAATLAAEARIRELEADAEKLKFLTRNPSVTCTENGELWQFSIETKEKHRHAYNAIAAALTEHKENQ